MKRDRRTKKRGFESEGEAMKTSYKIKAYCFPIIMIMLNRIRSVIFRLELLRFRRDDGVPYCVSFFRIMDCLSGSYDIFAGILIFLSGNIISVYSLHRLFLGELFFEFGRGQGFGIFREVETKCAAFAETAATKCGLTFEYMALSA